MKPVRIEFKATPIQGGYITPAGVPLKTSYYVKWVRDIDDLLPEEKSQLLKQFASMQYRFNNLTWLEMPTSVVLITDKALFYSIVHKIVEVTGISIDEITSRSRKSYIVLARMMLMALLRKKMYLSLVTIGKWFNRDHTTVIHAIQTIKDLIDTDENFRCRWEQLYNHDYLSECQSPLQIAG